jgi:hypothetical protein
MRLKMVNKKSSMCPLFPDLICPQGEEVSNACSVRITGDFDPIAYFRDHLLLHCALYQNQQIEENLKRDKR